MEGKILVVDDNPITIKLLTRILDHEGYFVETATSGIKAFEILNGSKPDLILLDIMMPELNGYKIAEKIKQTEELKDIPIIMISALNDNESKAKGFQAGASEFITKPFDRVDLVTKVNNLIKIKRQSDIIKKAKKK